jgi:hypothetical protein
MTVILRLIWPYLARFLMNRGAEYTANYLQTRRERRSMQQTEPEIAASLPPQAVEEPVLSPEILYPPSTSARFLVSDAFWFTMSGILLGSAFSIIVAYLFKKVD